jgi:hypothetical protein
MCIVNTNEDQLPVYRTVQRLHPKAHLSVLSQQLQNIRATTAQAWHARRKRAAENNGLILGPSTENPAFIEIRFEHARRLPFRVPRALLPLHKSSRVSEEKF